MSHGHKAHPHRISSVEHASALARIWPVGAVFLSAIDTDPGELLEFGTWDLIGTDRVLAGIALVVYVWRRVS
jgi:hypothetical protein